MAGVTTKLAPAALSILLLGACGDRPDIRDVTGPDVPPPDGPIVYVTQPPAGNLPWPHHAPGWDASTYAAKADSLWVVNNFGAYTGTSDRSVLYLHDAWDLVLPNGTAIHAVAPGTVISQTGGDEYYRTLLVEDSARPGYAWSYTHIYQFKVAPGDRVQQGTLLGVVNFRGLEHIHLARVRLQEGGSWFTVADVETLHPDDYFAYRDTEPPAFEGPFRYLRNLTDSAFTAPPDGRPVVHGDVDIVVGVRDDGEWTRSKTPFGGAPSYGNAHAVTRLEYEIEGTHGVIVSATAFDLERTVITRESPARRAQQLLTMYQHYESVSPAPSNAGSSNGRYGFVVITNSAGSVADDAAALDPADATRSWRTAELAPDGTRLFPDGDYVVTVRAFDSTGNMAARSDTVTVRN